VVYFRVSEEEYRQINELCEKRGARNVSDLVREAMDRLVKADGDGFEREVTRRLTVLEESLDQLNRKMARGAAAGAN
jgi:Arc/MetJ-type ribon-helix-helix transcriptional regulator